jgi:NADH-quinone oxidoreductase subunit C
MTNEETLLRLTALCGGSILEQSEFRGDLTVVVQRDDIVRVAEQVRDDPGLSYDLLVDLLGVDRYQPGDRYEVVYQCYSLAHKRYLRLKVRVPEEPAAVPTVTGVWPAANWFEREAWDMYGIRFTGHPDLRRLYMPEHFDYHPLRKDFPVMGVPDSLPLPRR